MGSGRSSGGSAGGIGIGNNYWDDAGSGADLDLDTHEAVGGMKSLIFWTVLALSATVSASWMQKDNPEVSSPVAIVQQQVQPQFPAQALGGGQEPMPTRPEEMPRAPSGPPVVMPRTAPGMPPPPQAMPIPGAPVAQSGMRSAMPVPPTMIQHGGLPPGVSAPNMQPQIPPVQTAVPINR